MSTRFPLAAALLLPLLAMFAGGAGAVGLGRIEPRSHLHQPFAAKIPLIGLKAGELEDLRVGLADEAAFDRQGIEFAAVHGGFRFELVSTGPTSGHVLVRSTESIREPSLSFIVALDQQGGRIMRSYVVLLNAH
jgi:pilus assembly protein FimV